MSKYTVCEYTISQINKAGKKYAAGNLDSQTEEDVERIINNWRAAHAYPLQAIYVALKMRASGEYNSGDYTIASRLKRMSSITGKLKRFPTMKLERMQDLGGCRVIVNSLEDVYDFVDKIKNMKWKHEWEEPHDYIENPKKDGYRSYHIILRFNSRKKPEYNGMRIEIQVRTRIQHLWATALETIDSIDKDNLKGGAGRPENSQFFLLASKLLEKYEKGIYDIPTSEEARQLREFEKQTHVLHRLSEIRRTETLGSVVEYRSGYFILVSNSDEQKTDIYFYENEKIALSKYEDLECHKNDAENIVLVNTESIKNLQKVYPNYFADISDFVKLTTYLISNEEEQQESK